MKNLQKKLSNITLIGIDCVNLERLKIAADICQKFFLFGGVKLLSSIPDNDPHIVKIPKIKSTVEYSEFCIKEMWKYVETDFALVFQYDGFILNPSAWTDKFLNYDYIGAPWYCPGAPRVGNGGFSLRSKRLLNFISQNCNKIGGAFSPEDLWICETARPFLEKAGMRFAPEEIASHFSKEGNERGVIWNGEFGWHGAKYTDISKWLEQNPQYQKIFAQKLDDFTTFMLKYPIYNGVVHVFNSKPIQVTHYKKLASGEKNYDCRIDLDLRDVDKILPGHKIVYKLFRILLTEVGVPTFERQVKKIEKFSSKTELLKTHPKIKITPSFYLSKWQQRLVPIFENFIFPNNNSYTLIWFE